MYFFIPNRRPLPTIKNIVSTIRKMAFVLHISFKSLELLARICQEAKSLSSQKPKVKKRPKLIKKVMDAQTYKQEPKILAAFGLHS